VGWLGGGMSAWRTSGRHVATVGQLTAHEAHALAEGGSLAILDVRLPAEWLEGHADRAHFLTGAELPSRLVEVPSDRPVAVVCGSGFRSSVAASLLAAQGYDARVVVGGMEAWRAAGLPTVA
jgi:hydroxyacylglutathione hydrolase